ncbi:MAG: hypothetical protein WCB68_10090 [Pyrinomonadaceae bacterium]
MMAEMKKADAEEALRAALERHEQARLHYIKMASEFSGEIIEGEPFVMVTIQVLGGMRVSFLWPIGM